MHVTKGLGVDQILSLPENTDGPCIFELFGRETNLGKTHTVNTTHACIDDGVTSQIYWACIMSTENMSDAGNTLAVK